MSTLPWTREAVACWQFTSKVAVAWAVGLSHSRGWPTQITVAVSPVIFSPNTSGIDSPAYHGASSDAGAIRQPHRLGQCRLLRYDRFISECPDRSCCKAAEAAEEMGS